MKLLKSWLLIIFLLAVSVLILLSIWWLLVDFFGNASAQNSQIVVALIAFAGTIIGAVYVQQRTKAREIAEAHRPIKTALYMGFISQVIDLMRQNVGKKELDEEQKKKLEDFFFNFTSKAMLWGSPGVLKNYSAFRSVGNNPNIILYIDDVLTAMREDLGLSNRGLSRGDLIKMLLTDPEKLDALLQGRPA